MWNFKNSQILVLKEKRNFTDFLPKISIVVSDSERQYQTNTTLLEISCRGSYPIATDFDA